MRTCQHIGDSHTPSCRLNYPEAFCFSTFYPVMIEISQLEILVHPRSFLFLPWSWGFSMLGKRFPSGKHRMCQPHICSIGNLKAAAATEPFYKPEWRGFSQNRRSVNISQQGCCDPSWAIPVTLGKWICLGPSDAQPVVADCHSSTCICCCSLQFTLNESSLKSLGFDTSQLWSIKTFRDILHHKCICLCWSIPRW